MSGGFHRYRDNGKTASSTSSTSKSKNKVHNLLRELESEFDKMLVENTALKSRIQLLEEGPTNDDEPSRTVGAANLDTSLSNKGQHQDEHDMFEKSVLKSFTKNKAFKTRHKLKAHTSKIVSSFKPPSMSCMLVKEFRGHRDGIWDISVSRLGHPLIGTASADKTARIWGVDSGRCLSSYVGHNGSVNSIAFHPTQDLTLTASGDGTAHIWKYVVLSHVLGGASSEESPDSESEDTDAALGKRESRSAVANTIKAPIIALTGHQGVVSGCEWLNDELCVTSSWDRTANLYNVETGSNLQTLAGHDRELTHVACHPTQRLVATCSMDSTFRLWDFRETIHSVSVFQGHTEAVMCACFSRSEQIVSGSDDRTVKVWDLRNMRAPVTSIQTSAAVNRLSISPGGLIAIPQDNRHVVIHDLLNGQKLTRLPRDTSHTHHRMVTSTAWALEETEGKWKSRANLFSAGFDRVGFGWSIRDQKDGKSEHTTKGEKSSKDATF